MRARDDFVVSSHLAFLPAVVVALIRGLYDAVALITVMVFLSIWYHREAEKNQLIAKIELCSTGAVAPCSFMDFCSAFTRPVCWCSYSKWNVRSLQF